MTKKTGKPKRELTKRQLSRWQQERKRTRLILGAGIFTIVAVLGIVGAGWYSSQYQPLHQTVIRVNDREFDMDYYIRMLKLYGKGLSPEYMNALADEVVRVIERNELIRQGATELGISVTAREVNDELKRRTPALSKDYSDSVRAELLANKLRDQYFEQKVPQSAEQRRVMAMLLESQSQAAEVRARIEKGEDFAQLAGELSLESLSQSKKDDLGWHPKDALAGLLATSVPGDYAFSADIGVLSQPIQDEEVTKKVGYWLLKVLERREASGEAHVQAMLLSSKEQAQTARANLEGGTDFATQAKELSQLVDAKENGGDLGWVTPSKISPAFDGFVFQSAEKGVSQPIRDEAVSTTGGYWLVKVLEKDDNREIEKSDRDLLKTKALNEWVAALWLDPKNQIDDSYLNAEKKAWAVEKAIREASSASGVKSTPGR